jgi:hypothetical protein
MSEYARFIAQISSHVTIAYDNKRLRGYNVYSGLFEEINLGRVVCQQENWTVAQYLN